MSIEQVQTVGGPGATVVVPGADEYDDASDGWTEAEFRADAPQGSIVARWTGEPGWVRIDEWPYTEVCVLLSGAVELEDADGATRRFVAGDSFLIPQGFRGVWHTLEHSEKVFVGIGA